MVLRTTTNHERSEKRTAENEGGNETPKMLGTYRVVGHVAGAIIES